MERFYCDDEETIMEDKDGDWVKYDDVTALQAENKELKELFDLQHKRSLEADQLWQESTGETCMPDLGKLLDWFMKKQKQLQAENKELKEEVEDLRSGQLLCCRGGDSHCDQQEIKIKSLQTENAKLREEIKAKDETQSESCNLYKDLLNEKAKLEAENKELNGYLNKIGDDAIEEICGIIRKCTDKEVEA